MTEYHTDVAIVGAGAAGLAAARRLHERGADFLLIEGRDRVGGRAHTARSSDGSLPVELGAEFVHGNPESTLAVLRETGSRALPSDGAFMRLRAHGLEEEPDLWETVQAIFARLNLKAADLTVDDFLLEMVRGGEPPDHVEWVRAMIEGFDAAITSNASAIAIAKEWLSGVNDTASRPERGYAPLMHYLANYAKDRIHLNSRVCEIVWSPQKVVIRGMRDGKPVEFHARRAIVTLPAGVLQQGSVAFHPALPAPTQRAIDAIVMGPVIKVVLEFRNAFWEHTDGGRYRDAGFFQAPECRIRTMWTQLPKRVPLLTAWAGGGAAARFAEHRLDPVSAALETCRALFPAVDAHAELVGAYFHDWQSDPFACGAYSYLRVNGVNARDALAVPVGQTLFFAGEATSSDDPGTVAGALDSGYRAADAALAC